MSKPLLGEMDKVQPPAYAETLKKGISGPVTVQTIAGAGHMAELDHPEAAAVGRAAEANYGWGGARTAEIALSPPAWLAIVC